ncbi:hypothetical protein BGZ49_003757 [Haplosporangium sp. Z 27]|nr:hypothetical protein BGZ49_003757 [Haplosporangium sp. Z 27]
MSPFRLAAGVPDPPPISIYSSHSSSSYQSYTGIYFDSPTSWPRFLDRTKLLLRLLIQNLEITHLGQIPRHRKPVASIMDDFDGLEHVEPLIPSIYNSLLSSQPPAIEIPHDWTSNTNLTNFDIGQDEWGVVQQDQPNDQYPDLISFDDHWDDPNPNTTNQETDSKKEQSDHNGRKNASGTGLIMDYFHFYTHQDHRSISSVIREIYPGAGRREYDKYLADIERAILMHNSRQIEKIHIQSPSVVIPHLREHLEKFERLSDIDFMDPVWDRHELELVYQFLMDYSSMFSRPSQPSELEAAEKMNSLNLRDSVVRHRSTIRNFKYTTSRNHWDHSMLAGQPFDPLLFMKALGPGLETIECDYWLKTKPIDLETLDVRSLRSLKIGYLVTPQEDVPYSQPEFLSRCRQLTDLDTFSNSRDMFRWAVQDWNAIRKKGTGVNPANNGAKDPWIRSETRSPAVKSLVRLQNLRIHGPTDDVVYEIIRDAFYGFRETLRSVEARSDMESTDGEAEWMDHALHLLSARHPMDSARVGSRAVCDTTKMGEGDENAHYENLSSISSSSLLIRWKIPHLSKLDLSGPIASAFDIGSLHFMPNLQAACFSITTTPSPWVARGQSNRSKGDSFSQTKRNMTDLPFVAPPTLRRVMIRGPWPEITDRSLQAMIDTIILPSDHHCRSHNGPKLDSDNDNDNDDDDGSWGGQLLELSILDNDRVTVEGMIRLARQMNRLQVMGTGLNMVSFSYDKDLETSYSSVEEHRFYKQNHSNERESDLTMKARDLILKAQIELPRVDLGPEANHLGKRVRRDRYLGFR